MSNNSCNNTDRLAQINNELRDKVNVDTPWLPLESNPDIFYQVWTRCKLCVVCLRV